MILWLKMAQLDPEDAFKDNVKMLILHLRLKSEIALRQKARRSI